MCCAAGHLLLSVTFIFSFTVVLPPCDSEAGTNIHFTLALCFWLLLLNSLEFWFVHKINIHSATAALVVNFMACSFECLKLEILCELAVRL